MIEANSTDVPAENIDHTPQAHPASPTHELPSSFASYRQKATQHGPLGSGQQGSGGPTPSSSSASASSALSSLSSTARGGPMTYGAIGGKSGRSLGSIKPKDGLGILNVLCITFQGSQGSLLRLPSPLNLLLLQDNNIFF